MKPVGGNDMDLSKILPCVLTGKKDIMLFLLDVVKEILRRLQKEKLPTLHQLMIAKLLNGIEKVAEPYFEDLPDVKRYLQLLKDLRGNPFAPFSQGFSGYITPKDFENLDGRVNKLWNGAIFDEVIEVGSSVKNIKNDLDTLRDVRVVLGEIIDCQDIVGVMSDEIRLEITTVLESLDHFINAD